MTNGLIDTILLVEDDPADVELALHIIETKVSSIRVVVARSGYEALKFLFPDHSQSTLPLLENLKAVLLDLHLPGLDGFEVLTRLKSDLTTKAIPAIILTSSLETKDVTRSYMLGANSYVVKPIDVEEYERVLRDTVLYWLHINEFPSPHTPTLYTDKKSA